MANAKASRGVKLVGTDSVDPKSRTLRAGALSVEFGNGALRYIRVGDVEVIRQIAFLVRDKNWGTYNPEISALKVSQKKDGFTVTYRAKCGDASNALVYDATISCGGGSLEFAATCTPETDFPTNRTGFIVLHPLTGVAGFPVEVEYTNGRREKSKFPPLVNPACPFTDIRALKHKVMDGLEVVCRMTGYAFEMEDHRNWSDASFKTYVRPLAEPWPYTMPKGKSFTQKVSLTFIGKLPRPKKAGAGGKRIEVALGRAGRALPAVGAAVPMEEAARALDAVDAIKAAGLQHLTCHIDGRQSDVATPMKSYRRLADATGAAVVLEIILPGKAAPAGELARIADAARQVGIKPEAVSIAVAQHQLGILPGTKRPEEPAFADIYKAARNAFPGAKIGGGTFTFFTELNRNRPPAGLIDYVTHTTGPVVHAADDVSVMETLEAHPYQIKSVRSLFGKAGYRLGPSAIPARTNPYGASSAPNPNNERVCLSQIDPRQRGLFGAAWNVGYVSAWARGGLDAVTLGAVTGPAGMVYRKTDHAQPYYDSLGRKAVYPLYHVIADLAKARGAKQIATDVSQPGAAAALAYRGKDGPVLWLANLTPQPQTVRVSGFTGAAKVAMLDEGSFAKATTDTAFLEKSGKRVAKVGNIALRPYAVARIAATK